MFKRLCMALAIAGVATITSATPVTSLADLTSKHTMLTVTFTEQRLSDNHSLAELGQPLESVGLVLPNQVLTSNAIDGFSRGEAVRSSQIDNATNSNVQSLQFIYAQKDVGFTILDTLATNITITAYDGSGKELEHTTLSSSKNARFAGFSREKAEIVRILIDAQHNTMADAVSSPTVIDDITFASPLFERTTMAGGAGGSNEIITGDGTEAFGHQSNLFASADMPDISPSGGSSRGTTSSLRTNIFQAAPLSNPTGLGYGTPTDPADPKLVIDPGVPGTNIAVPEPASIAISAMLILPALLRRRRTEELAQ